MTTPVSSTSTAGKSLGIVGVILAFLIPIVGLIVSIVARGQSKRAGVKNGAATAGIIISLLIIVVGIIVGITVGTSLAGACAELGSGVHDVNGVTVTCS